MCVWGRFQCRFRTDLLRFGTHQAKSVRGSSPEGRGQCQCAYGAYGDYGAHAVAAAFPLRAGSASFLEQGAQARGSGGLDCAYGACRRS